MADTYYQIIVSGAKRDYRISRNKAEVSRLVAAYKRDPKIERVQVTHGTKNDMKKVSDWERSKRAQKKLTATQAVRAEKHQLEKAKEQARSKQLAELDRYTITFHYVKGGDETQRSAIGYREMRSVRSETWRAARKYKGGRAYRVHTVNVTKGRIVN